MLKDNAPKSIVILLITVDYLDSYGVRFSCGQYSAIRPLTYTGL